MSPDRLRELILLLAIGSALTLAVFFLALWLPETNRKPPPGFTLGGLPKITPARQGPVARAGGSLALEDSGHDFRRPAMDLRPRET